MPRLRCCCHNAVGLTQPERMGAEQQQELQHRLQAALDSINSAAAVLRMQDLALERAEQCGESAT